MEEKLAKVQYTHSVSKDALRQLWEICFPEDGDGFARFFLDNYYSPSQAICIVHDSNDTVESALYWLPCTYRIGDHRGTFLYIYAMGTHPTYRKQGNLRCMLEFMERHCLENGFDGIVLHAMDTSKSSVERFGMKPLLTLEERRYFQQDVQAGDWCEGSFALFQELRNRYLAGCTGCVYWEEQELRFVYEDLRRDKKIRFFCEEDGIHYGIVSLSDDGYYIEETDCEWGLLRRISGPVVRCGPGKGSYGAHIKVYRKSLQEQDLCKLYFNLMMK